DALPISGMEARRLLAAHTAVEANAGTGSSCPRAGFEEDRWQRLPSSTILPSLVERGRRTTLRLGRLRTGHENCRTSGPLGACCSISARSARHECSG